MPAPPAAVQVAQLRVQLKKQGNELASARNQLESLKWELSAIKRANMAAGEGPRKRRVSLSVQAGSVRSKREDHPGQSGTTDDDTEQWRAENELLGEIVTRLKRNREELLQQNANLNGRLQHTEDELSKVNAEYDKLQDKCEEMKDVIADLHSNGGGTVSFGSTIPQGQSVQDVVQRWRNDIEKLQQAHAEDEDRWRGEIERLERQVRILKGTEVDVEAVHQLRQEKSNLVEENWSFMKQIRHLKDENNKLRKRAQSERESAQNQIDGAVVQRDEALRQLKRVKKECQQKIETLVRKMQRLALSRERPDHNLEEFDDQRVEPQEERKAEQQQQSRQQTEQKYKRQQHHRQRHQHPTQWRSSPERSLGQTSAGYGTGYEHKQRELSEDTESEIASIVIPLVSGVGEQRDQQQRQSHWRNYFRNSTTDSPVNIDAHILEYSQDMDHDFVSSAAHSAHVDVERDTDPSLQDPYNFRSSETFRSGPSLSTAWMDAADAKQGQRKRQSYESATDEHIATIMDAVSNMEREELLRA